MHPLASTLSKIAKQSINATSDAYSYASDYGFKGLNLASGAMSSVNPYLQTASLLAPVGKYLYNLAFGNKGKRPLTTGNYTDAVQEFQGQDVDFASSLSKQQFSQRASESDKSVSELEGLLKMMNEQYETANKQDSFRGLY